MAQCSGDCKSCEHLSKRCFARDHLYCPVGDRNVPLGVGVHVMAPMAVIEGDYIRLRTAVHEIVLLHGVPYANLSAQGEAQILVACADCWHEHGTWNCFLADCLRAHSS